jgi:hypothetical protein
MLWTRTVIGRWWERAKNLDSQVNLDLGMSVAETIERRIQGVERNYWSYR